MTRLRKIAIGAGAGIGLGAMFFGMCWVFVTVMDALTAALGRNVAAVVSFGVYFGAVGAAFAAWLSAPTPTEQQQKD